MPYAPQSRCPICSSAARRDRRRATARCSSPSCGIAFFAPAGCAIRAACFSADDWEPSTYKRGPHHNLPCLRNRVTGEARPLADQTQGANPPPVPPAVMTIEGNAYGRPVLPAAKVVFGYGARDELNRMFSGSGPPDPWLLAAACCGVDGAKVIVEKNSYASEGGVRVTVMASGLDANRTMRPMQGGGVQIENVRFSTAKGSGHDGNGAAIFLNQIRALRAMGVRQITSHAAGDLAQATRDGYNGYVTWPKFGFDGDMKNEALVQLPAVMQKALGTRRNVQSLLALPGGAEAWELYGDDIDPATFDLRDGSESLERLGAYLEGRRQRKAAGQEKTRQQRAAVSPDPKARYADRVQELMAAMVKKIRDSQDDQTSRQSLWSKAWRTFT